jgi:xanthine dehydrogenase molybdenum-binding subunit
MRTFKHIGKSYPRSDGLEKVTGKALFVTDMKVPDMLIGKILRSPYAHARIAKIDTSAAEMISQEDSIIMEP